MNKDEVAHNAKDRYDFKAAENKWIHRWETDGIYHAEVDHTKPKYYCLDTWAYPSAEGVHVGYVKSFCGMDAIARYKRMRGYNVLYPTGWDTFGLPAENYAIKAGRHPRDITNESIQNFKKQFHAFGLSYDWTREINTADPEYYRWTQWIFLLMYRKGLAYRKLSKVQWCPKDKTVLAHEQVINGQCERCGETVEEKELMQWFFKVSEYADRLYEDSSKLQWEDKHLNVHKKWIGKEIDQNENTQFHVRDWSVARQRYWGPPIPIIYCDTCGTVPVPESQLPVLLPDDVDFTPTGEAPLSKNDAFVETTCPQCGNAAKREVDILDTFVSSAWYEWRFPDPHTQSEAVSSKAVTYWGPVDHYQGTIEHLTAHLVYARFVTKVLFDAGVIPFDEPFPKYTPVGLLVDKEGTKFSKRLGNAPDTNALIDDYGGDLLRLSAFFVSPFGDISRWGIQDIVGVEKFRNKVWRVHTEKVDGAKHPVDDDLRHRTHTLVKEVGENIEQMKYNVAISRMMVYVNTLSQKDGPIDVEVWRTFVQVLAPFAPFIAEEMWSSLGAAGSVHASAWPQYDPTLTTSMTVSIAVQVNGKTKNVVEVPMGSTQDEVLQVASKLEKMASVIERSTNILFVRDRVINIVEA